jgi:hypothetical protein
MSMTVPTNTTSSGCKPWHVPAGAFEHVQADIPPDAKNNNGSITKITRRIIVDIVHGAARGIECEEDDSSEKCPGQRHSSLEHTVFQDG